MKQDHKLTVSVTMLQRRCVNYSESKFRRFMPSLSAIVPLFTSSGQILLPRYLMNGWNSFDKTEGNIQ